MVHRFSWWWGPAGVDPWRCRMFSGEVLRPLSIVADPRWPAFWLAWTRRTAS